MIKLENFINSKHLNLRDLSNEYENNLPFSHICLDDFFNADIINTVESEFPDLQQLSEKFNFKNSREIKFASKGMQDLSPAAFNLISFLNSDVFLKYLQDLTGVEEILISDPYLSGGGYHQIKSGGFLKVHADFNKHPFLDLHRRLNLIVYLNKDWEDSWGGHLQLFDTDMKGPIQKILPIFNRVVIFTTRSDTYHGHPDPLTCPNNIDRKSLALYYFSDSRPDEELTDTHSTIFKERDGESFLMSLRFRKSLSFIKSKFKLFR